MRITFCAPRLHAVYPARHTLKFVEFKHNFLVYFGLHSMTQSEERVTYM